MIRRIVFLGFPGCGKGTQSVLLGKELDIIPISTGELFRTMIHDGKDSIADQVRLCVHEGRLVSDTLTFDVVRPYISCDCSWLLDGFPRNLNQAMMLEDLCPPTNVIFIDVDKEIIFKRIIGRRLAKNSGKMYNVYQCPPKKEGFCDDTGEELVQREDDQFDAVQKRLDIYQKETKPLVEYYCEKGILHSIKGNLLINQVYQNLKEVLGI